MLTSHLVQTGGNLFTDDKLNCFCTRAGTIVQVCANDPHMVTVMFNALI